MLKMENKLQGMLTVLKLRLEVYKDLLELKIIERDGYSVTSQLWSLADTSRARLEAKVELTEEHIADIEELLADVKQEA
jgi:hypothetical protein